MKKTRRQMLDRALKKKAQAESAKMALEVAESAHRAKVATEKMREAESEKESLCKALYGDMTGHPLVFRTSVMIEDNVVGAIPPVLIKFVRVGKAYEDWRNDFSKYNCDIVIEKNAVLTKFQASVLYDKIREVLNYANDAAAKERRGA